MEGRMPVVSTAVRLAGGNLLFFRARVLAALTTGLTLDSELADHDALIERLTHVIHGERGDRGCRHGFHFDARSGGSGSGCADRDALARHFGPDINKAKRQGMTHRNELGCSLRGLD